MVAVSLLRSRFLSRHATLLPTKGCWKPNHIPFPLFFRSVEQTNQESLYKNGVTFRGKNSMLLSLLEMQLRGRVWTEQLLKRLSIVILDVLRVPRRREIKIKYIFLVKVPLVFKKSSKRRSMWMWAVFQTAANCLFAGRYVTSDWQNSNGLRKKSKISDAKSRKSLIEESFQEQSD